MDNYVAGILLEITLFLWFYQWGKLGAGRKSDENPHVAFDRKQFGETSEIQLIFLNVLTHRSLTITQYLNLTYP
jgi:hypothetical protein